METTVTSKGQVVIPALIRKELGITAGTSLNVEFDRVRGEIVLKPITRDYIRGLSGRFKGKGLLDELAKERKQEKERDERR